RCSLVILLQPYLTITLVIFTHIIKRFDFFFSSRRRHTRFSRDWSSDVCSSDLFFSSAISEIEKVAVEHEYTVLMGQSHDDAARELKILKTFRKHRVDGILMSLGKNTEDLSFIKMLADAEVPIVFFDCVPSIDGVNKVYSDLSTGMRDAVQSFASLGHKNIALINGPRNVLASQERAAAYKKALKSENLEYSERYEVDTDLTEQGNIEAIDKLLTLSERP